MQLTYVEQWQTGACKRLNVYPRGESQTTQASSKKLTLTSLIALELLLRLYIMKYNRYITKQTISRCISTYYWHVTRIWHPLTWWGKQRQGVCTGRTRDTGLEGGAVNKGLPKFSDFQKMWGHKVFWTFLGNFGSLLQLVKGFNAFFVSFYYV